MTREEYRDAIHAAQEQLNNAMYQAAIAGYNVVIDTVDSEFINGGSYPIVIASTVERANESPL